MHLGTQTRSQPQTGVGVGSARVFGGSCLHSRKKSGGGTPRGLWVDFLQNTIPLPPSEILLCLFLSILPPPSGRVPISVLQELEGRSGLLQHCLPRTQLEYSLSFCGRDHPHWTNQPLSVSPWRRGGSGNVSLAASSAMI